MTGLVQALQSHAERLDVGVEVVDTCGTGGDRSGTINVSTFSALVVAGAGAVVCKHGGRRHRLARFGATCARYALGMVLSDQVRTAAHDGTLDTAGIGFCFAPRFHPMMRLRRAGAP